jgi:AraC family transcriptional regulator of adaptative response/methylated-DNA-[protein]-cysteine methyltransferase
MQPMTTDAVTPDVSQSFATDDERWAAVSRRDRAADGVFFSAVVTTGVYCRPSCAGRPLRKNVRFYASAAQARQAGFRACKRCHPDRIATS